MFCWSISEWGQCCWPGQYHIRLNTAFSLKFSSLITFVFSHKERWWNIQVHNIACFLQQPKCQHLPTWAVCHLSFPLHFNFFFFFFYSPTLSPRLFGSIPSLIKIWWFFFEWAVKLTSFLRCQFAFTRLPMTSMVLQYWATFGVLPRRCAEYECFHEVCGPISHSGGEMLQMKKFRNENLLLSFLGHFSFIYLMWPH